jgi:hypothetical protein
MSPLGLKVGATAITVLGLLGSMAYVLAHPKNPAAPLHPPVVRAAQPSPAPAATRGRLHVEPSVRIAELKGITFTHVS